MHLSTWLVWIFTLWNHNLEPPPSHAFFLLYPSNTDVNVIFWNTSHHQNVIIWCLMSPHDALITSYSFWWECIHICLVYWADTLTQSGDLKADIIIHPSWGGKLPSSAYHDTLPQVPWCAPALSQPGYNLLKTCQKYKWLEECTESNQNGWSQHSELEYKIN